MIKASQSQFSGMKQNHKERILGPCLYTTTFCPSNAHTILCWSIAAFHCCCCFSWEIPARLEQVFKCKCLCWKSTCLCPCEHWTLRKSPPLSHMRPNSKKFTLTTQFNQKKNHKTTLPITRSPIKSCKSAKSSELQPETQLCSCCIVSHEECKISSCTETTGGQRRAWTAGPGGTESEELQEQSRS